MALRTKNAIRRSFIELLAERPFDKISAYFFISSNPLGRLILSHSLEFG